MRYAVVCIGTSWGGLNALRQVVRALGGDFTLPVIIVQHRHRDSSDLLAGLLQECTTLPIAEVEDKLPIEPGRIYLAPPDYHLLIDDDAFSLSLDAPVRFSRPSIDVTFHSAAHAYGRRTIGVVLTGANADGADGLRRIVDVGGVGIVQDPTTAESRTMPDAALLEVPEAHVVALNGIAAHLRELAAQDLPAPVPRAKAPGPVGPLRRGTPGDPPAPAPNTGPEAR